jgi:uncharacterized cupredoxin-like copper-binding protein
MPVVRCPNGAVLWAGISLIVALSVAASVCGGTTAAKEVQVILADYSVKPSAASVTAGQLTFVAKNDAAQVHELVIIKTDLAPEALKMESNEVDEAGSGQKIGEIEDVEAGKTQKATFDLPAGRHVLICNIPDHYQRGMVAVLEAK